MHFGFAFLDAYAVGDKGTRETEGGLIGCDDLIACGMSREGEGKSEETIARGGHEGEAKYLSHQDDVSSLVFSVVMMR
jgi:hypothetical protein